MASAQPISFGALLRRHRVAAGLTQEGLAERARLSARAISDLERGIKRTPRSDTLRLLIDALGLGERERAAFEAAARGRPVPASPQSPPDSPSRAPHVLRSTATLPLVGRQDELALIEDHISGAGPPLLLLAGEPGIGKTRLLQEAFARGLADGWTMLVGGCTRRSGQEPYSPLLETIAGFLRARSAAQLRADLDACAWLVRLLPELSERSIVPAPSWTLPPEQERRLMFAAVRRLLINVAGPSGTLLLLDDLQWAGADTIHLLSTLFQPPSPFEADAAVPPLRLLGAYRSTEVRTRDPLGLMLAELGPLGLAGQLTLSPLTPDAADGLLELLLADVESGHRGHRPPLSTDPALRERLLKRAGGVPFYLVSCAQGLRSGALSVPSGSAAMSHGADAIPWDVAQSVRRRISALPEPAQTLLGIAAVAGRVVLRPDLFAVARQAGCELADDNAALAALEALTHACLLSETGDLACTFTHDLIREVVLTDLTAARREAWHVRVGEALERLPEPARRRRAAELAWHFVRGAEGARALPYTLDAGDQAAELYAHDEADGHFRAALALARELGAPRREAEALEKRGLILRLLERDDEATEVFTQAIDAYRKLGDIEGVWRATSQLAGVYGILGMPERGRDLLQPVIAAARQSAPSKALAAIHLEFSWLSWLSDDLEERLATAEQTVRVAAAAGESRVQGEAEFQRGNTLLMLGRVEEALRSLERAIPLLEATGHLRRLCSTLNVIGGIHKLRGEFGAMRTYGDRALEVAMTVGVRSQLRYTWANQGDAAYLLGDWKRAEEAYEQAMKLSDREGDRLESSQVFGGLGLLRLCEGAIAEGTDLLERAISHAAQQGAMDAEQSLAAHAAHAEGDLLAGRARAALERLAPLLAPLDRQAFYMTQWLPLLAWATLDLGAGDEAEILLAEAIARAVAQSNRLTLVDAWRVRGLLATRMGEWRKAGDALDEALMATRAMPYAYAEAKILYAYGLLHSAQGAPRKARERFAAALAICGRLGEGLYRPHIERALAALTSDGCPNAAGQ